MHLLEKEALTGPISFYALRSVICKAHNALADFQETCLVASKVETATAKNDAPVSVTGERADALSAGERDSV